MALLSCSVRTRSISPASRSSAVSQSTSTYAEEGSPLDGSAPGPDSSQLRRIAGRVTREGCRCPEMTLPIAGEASGSSAWGRAATASPSEDTSTVKVPQWALDSRRRVMRLRGQRRRAVGQGWLR